jgi:outer membrane protein assembly factor BamD (BamD/ComL family)
MMSPALVALACAVLSGTSPSLQRSERYLRDEMAFARELAIRYQYMDLAETVLSGLANERLGEKEKESLALVQSQVFTEGAKREGDPKKRLATFEKAGQSFRNFFAAHPFSELLPEAERSYLGLVNNYGRALELALDEAVGEEATALRETIKNVLDEGLERTASLKDAYDRPDLSPAEKLEKWRLMLDRAQMLITHGNVSASPELDFSLAERELEKVAQEASETSGPGLNAFLALAKLNRSRGRYADAAAFAEFVVTISVPENHESDEWKDLPAEAKAERFKLVELAVPDLVESLAGDGKTEAACKWALYFYNAWKREGFTISPFGSLALLSAARTLLDAGGYVGGSMTQGNLKWFETEEEFRAANYSARDSRSALELALKTAQDVNTENKGNTLQIRAQKLISDVISRPGVDVPPEVLYEAALGEYNTQNYGAAVDSLKGVIRALDARDDATRREYMPKVLHQLGLAFGKQSRPLEAAMAFRDGATTWKGDPEFQPKLAQGFYREIGNVRRGAPGDKVLDELFLFGEKLVKESDTGTGADVIRWREAERAYGQGNFDGARKSYLTVGAVADEHEKALVKAALCLYKLNDKEGAKKEFKQYVEGFVTNPQNAITGARKLAAREEAKAQAVYYLGKMAYDAQAWDEALAVLGGYEKKYAAQSEYAPNALYMVTLAQIAKKDLKAARATAATMQQVFESSPATGKAALNLFQALKLEEEAATKAGDAPRAQGLQREMAQYMRVSNETSSEPNFSGLRTETALWLGLSEWVEAEKTLRATLKVFAEKPERKADIERFVQPDMGEALLGQRRVPEAFAVLDPLIPKDAADTRKPASQVVRDWCRTVGGWVEGEAELVEVPGVGGDFARANELLGKLIDAEKVANEAWSCPWYGLKFDQIYLLWQWSKADSGQKGKAKTLLDDIASQLGDPELKDIAAKCGDEALRRRYLWLRNQLR